MLSLHTASTSPGRGGHQIHFNNLSPLSKVLSQDPINYVELEVNQPSASHFNQGPDQDGRGSEINKPLSVQKASHPKRRSEQTSSTRVIGSPNGVESYPPVSTQSTRQPLVEVLSTATKTRPGRSRRSSSLSQYHQSMGNNASAMIRRSRSKLFREQGDSPETTVCASISPSLPQPHNSVVYPPCVHVVVSSKPAIQPPYFALKISTTSEPLKTDED